MLSTRQPHPSRSSQRTWSFIAAGLLAATYLLTSIVIASHRLFWYDEICTVIISRLPDVATIWKALAHGVDAQPPTYFMLVRIFEQLPIRPEITARLPSALAMVVGLLIAFDCARRLTDGVHGLIAFSVQASSGLSHYGYEARPYALYFMFASLALSFWIHASDSRVSSVLFGVVIFLAVASHYYAALCLVPYAAWEVCNWRRVRAARGKLIAGCLGVLCAAALFSRQILGMRQQIVPGSWAPPSLHSLAAIFDDLSPYGLFPLAAIMIWVALVGPREKGAVASAMQSSEQLGWFFGLIPLAGYVLAFLGTNAFVHRYFIGLLPGIAVAFSCLLWRQFRSARWTSIAALLLFAALGLGVQFTLLRHPESVRPLTGFGRPACSEPAKVNAMLLLDEKIPTQAKQFIVFPSSELLGVEARYYSKHPERYVFLLEPRVHERNTRGLMALGQYAPMVFWTREDLIAHARETVLVLPRINLISWEGTVAILERAGYKVTSHIDGGLEVVSVE